MTIITDCADVTKLIDEERLGFWRRTFVDAVIGELRSGKSEAVDKAIYALGREVVMSLGRNLAGPEDGN